MYLTVSAAMIATFLKVRLWPIHHMYGIEWFWRGRDIRIIKCKEGFNLISNYLLSRTTSTPSSPLEEFGLYFQGSNKMAEFRAAVAMRCLAVVIGMV